MDGFFWLMKWEGFAYLDGIEDGLQYVVVVVVCSARFLDLVGGPALPCWRDLFGTVVECVAEGLVEACE